MRNRASIALLALCLALNGVSSPAWAETVTSDKGGDMALDLIVTRPVGVLATIAGGAIFVLGLPFTIPSGSVKESACYLLERPAAYTFKRPLGDMDECRGGGCKSCDTEATR